jgi:hypothetical protein
MYPIHYTSGGVRCIVYMAACIVVGNFSPKYDYTHKEHGKNGGENFTFLENIKYNQREKSSARVFFHFHFSPTTMRWLGKMGVGLRGGTSRIGKKTFYNMKILNERTVFPLSPPVLFFYNNNKNKM